jgi:hypothetical protein
MNDTTLIQSAPDDPTAHRRWGHISNNPDDSVRNAALIRSLKMTGRTMQEFPLSDGYLI